MGQYFRANKLIAYFEETHRKTIVGILTEMPKVDAVEVVRCKDCKHWTSFEALPYCRENFGNCKVTKMKVSGDGFCHYGDRKEKRDG